MCRTLLSPELAASYARGRGCVAYFRGVEDTPVTIERVLRSGPTAVIEVRQRRAPRSWSRFVLDHHDDGWTAVDVIAGR